METTDTKLRTCSRCKEEKPLDPDHFQRNRSKPGGFKEACKLCSAVTQRKSRAKARVLAKRTPESEKQTKARRMALLRLVENHPTEYKRLILECQRKLGIAPKPNWSSVVFTHDEEHDEAAWR